MNTIDQFSFLDKKAIIRVDFNVPLNNGEVTDNSRIIAASPTIKKIISDGGSCILMSHLGRPKGVDQSLSMGNIAKEVERVLGLEILLSKDVIGPDAKTKSKNLKPGEILLLENLRFHNEETEGDIVFAEELSKLADCYINDAFGTAHRAHASTTIIAQFFEYKFFGRLLEKEYEHNRSV